MVLFVVELEIMGILDIRLSDIKNIIFPKAIQAAIISIWIGGSFIIGVFPVFTRIKRNLFPCTEFCIGQNIRIEEKNEKIRNFIFVTIILTIILGIIVNLISGFLF